MKTHITAFRIVLLLCSIHIIRAETEWLWKSGSKNADGSRESVRYAEDAVPEETARQTNDPPSLDQVQNVPDENGPPQNAPSSLPDFLHVPDEIGRGPHKIARKYARYAIYERPNEGGFGPFNQANRPLRYGNRGSFAQYTSVEGEADTTRQFDTCQCMERNNCQGLAYGECDLGKQYCCHNSRRYPVSNRFQSPSPSNGVLVGPGGPHDRRRPIPNRSPGFNDGNPGILVGPDGPTGILARPPSTGGYANRGGGILLGPESIYIQRQPFRTVRESRRYEMNPDELPLGSPITINSME